MSAPTLSQRIKNLQEKWRKAHEEEVWEFDPLQGYKIRHMIGWKGNETYLKCADELEPLIAEVAALEARLAEAEKSGKLFCAEQCEEGPEWGECEECGCHLFAIKKALGGVGVVGEGILLSCKVGGCNCFPKYCQNCPLYLGVVGEARGA